MIKERVNMKLRFVNKTAEVRRLQTHRGQQLRLEPRQTEDINFGTEKYPEEALLHYGRFGRFVEVIWLDNPKLGQEESEAVDQDLEPSNDGSSGDQNDGNGAQDDKDNTDNTDDSGNDDGSGSDDSDNDSDDESTLTREEVEALSYKELVRYARSKDVQAQKKADILVELFGE